MTIADLNPFAIDVLEDPYPLYAQLRESSPVHLIPDMGLYLVTRYADVQAAASRKEDFSSNLTALVMANAHDTEQVAPQLVEMEAGVDVIDVLATADPPSHAGQRKTVARTFRDIEASEPLVRALVEALLAPMIRAGSCELMDDFANWLPVQTIAAILGLPGADVVRIQRGAYSGVELLSGVTPPDVLGACLEDIIDFSQYIEGHLKNAASTVPERLLGGLAEAVADGALSIGEATAMALQIVIAGSDSTGNLIGSAVRLLSEHPEVQEQVRAEPALVPAYLEEVLRIESPFRGHFRVATRDTTLGDADIPEGARLFLMWGSANRDPEVFDRPDEIRLDRPNGRDHVGFGWGIHRCVGAPLARLEASVAMERLLANTTHIAPTPGAPAPGHIPSMLVRRLSHVHLDLETE
jgi:cytochrome P450 family 144